MLAHDVAAKAKRALKKSHQVSNDKVLAAKYRGRYEAYIDVHALMTGRTPKESAKFIKESE